MADNEVSAQPVSWTGSTAPNPHEGSRSERLAQFAFRRSAPRSRFRIRRTRATISVALCYCASGNSRNSAACVTEVAAAMIVLPNLPEGQ
jgi:hypothetical protein